ncbi:efflux RND transporter periplasmic adaptor subunit [Anaeromyxobacter oryzae]|uniref:MexH family multidrug efflux RND transporter periplasmic adaptor subunit n=1 Tax=Anaeromyxobacter oryzae TaxID=2918170 RepID=A0ABN6MZL7_9BACT|nr:efflux RND transporter periplasmic adaptor subunit [Anaeromyxobacter oryzae]BDG05163.1 MexH family multidrug efflux RND transporter periplasmic adaptor subunit [Anaeromyxobacter oryzae]
MKRNRTQLVVVIVGLVVVVGILAGVKAGQIVTMVRAGESFVPPPEAVASARVEAAQWESTRAAIGSIVAVRGVTLGAELPGLVREITFESGSFVKRGAVLVKLDTSAEEAQLAAAKADASLASLSLQRTRKLRQGEANAQADLDTAEARAKQANAAVANLEATIAKKTVRAPFDGRISIRQVELGQILSPGTPIASLQAVTPIHADFWLPQQALADLKPGQRVRMHTDAFQGASWDGEVTTVNPEVDPATRNVRVRATFPNDDGRLRPGMFANVEVLSEKARPVLTIPATAVIFAPYGDSVFAVEEKKEGTRTVTVAHQKFVRTGERRGDLVAVEAGLKAGEAVVSSGAFKLRNGAPVKVDNALAPKPQLAPNPTEQ